MEMNKLFRRADVKKDMQSFFLSEGFLQLEECFSDNLKDIRNKLLKIGLKEVYNPMILRKSEFLTSDSFDPEIVRFCEFFKSKDFLEYIENVTGFDLRLNKYELNMYKHKDFTLLHDSLKSKEDFIEVIFDISDKIEEYAGGTLTYTTKESEMFYLYPSFNTLTIIYKPEEVMKYLKYVNNKSMDQKIIRVEMQFEIIEEE